MESEIVRAGESMLRSASEVEDQIAAARWHPRAISAFVSTLTAWACSDEETAAGCMYALKRGGNVIEGPSIRFAEFAAAAWGNLRIRDELVGVDRLNKIVRVKGQAWDLQTNTAIESEVQVGIRYSDGTLYDDDMILTAIRAAASKARRNVILSIIPAGFIAEPFRQARATAIGRAQSLAERRTKAFEALSTFGLGRDAVLAYLGVSSDKEVTLDHIVLLRSLYAQIKEGEVTIEEALDQGATATSVPAEAPAASPAPAPAPQPAPRPRARQKAPATAAPEKDALVRQVVVLITRHPGAVLEIAGPGFSPATASVQELEDILAEAAARGIS